MTMMMQHFFARAVDLIALAGPDGTLLSHVVTAAVSSTDRSAQHNNAPRPAHVKWLHASLLEYPSLFHIQPVAARAPNVDDARRAEQAAAAQLFGDAHVTACDQLQTRALGISPLEHASLPPNAQRVMRLVGAAGQKGIIQADLPGLLGVPVGSAHHYLVTAIHSDLVARCRVFIEKKVSCTTPEDSAPSLSSRIVLARFASTFLFNPEDERGTESCSFAYFPCASHRGRAWISDKPCDDRTRTESHMHAGQKPQRRSSSKTGHATISAQDLSTHLPQNAECAYRCEGVASRY
jgi:hypothetical protein